jgi:hypothetical protein
MTNNRKLNLIIYAILTLGVLYVFSVTFKDTTYNDNVMRINNGVQNVK